MTIREDSEALENHARPAIDYAAKCKRLRTDGPTPCLCCEGECVGTPPLAPTYGDTDALETRHHTLSPPLRSGRLLIAFTGLAGSGKSTAAKHLVDAHGFQRIRFAGPLKSMLAALGLTQAEIDGDRKEVPCDLLCGRTPRWAMQSIGTEWGRELIGPDLWIRAWRAAVERTLPGSCIVVDDCRFPNEATAIKAAGGIIVRVDRPGSGAGAAGHSSEAQDLPADRAIRNVGSIDQLFAEVDAIARDAFHAWAAA